MPVISEPPRYSPASETTSNVVAVPKSTQTVPEDKPFFKKEPEPAPEPYTAQWYMKALDKDMDGMTAVLEQAALAKTSSAKPSTPAKAP